MEDLEIYAENTRSLLIYLTLNLMNINDRDAYVAASHIGRGVGITDVLKRLPGMMKLHLNPIPSEIMTRNGCTSFTLWDRHGTVLQELFDCILE